jgi:hypothetical protein
MIMIRWFFAAAVAAVTVSTASAAYIVQAIPHVAPFINSTPAAGVTAYYQNAILGLRAGTDAGTPGTLGYYIPQGTYTPGGAVNSISSVGADVAGLYRGVVNEPGFNGSLGSAMHMGMAIRTTAGETFSANDVSWSGWSYPNGSGPTALGTAPFSVGSAVGSSAGVFGATTVGGPLSLITDPNALYQEMYYIGEATSIVNNFGADWTDAASLTAYFPDPLTPRGYLFGSYTVNGNTGIGGTEVNAAPAPAAFALLGLGFAGVVTRLRRRMA